MPLLYLRLWGESRAAKRCALTWTGRFISTVNLTECQSKLVHLGALPGEAWEAVRDIVRESISFDDEQARIAGDLIRHTRPFGLSLGDRACLALGRALALPVLTTDRAWSSLQVGVTIHILR